MRKRAPRQAMPRRWSKGERIENMEVGPVALCHLATLCRSFVVYAAEPHLDPKVVPAAKEF